MKNFLTLFLLTFCFAAQATYMRIGVFTNNVGQPDTNTVWLYQVSGPIAADGGFTTKGLPVVAHVTADGTCTNFIMQDNWFATNKFLGKGILFGGFPNDSGPTVYNMSDWQISGLNTFVTRIITNGAGGSVTFGAVTNALGFLPLGTIPVTSTNQFAYTNGNWWDISGLAQASTNNPGIVRTDNSAFVLALTNGTSTNDIKVTRAGRTLFIGTNYDAGGTANAATNGIQNGAYADTNKFSTLIQLAAGTNAALAGAQIVANNLVTNSGNGITNNMMTLSNNVYRAGTNAPSTQSTFNATNGMQNGAFMDTNAFKVTITNIANGVSGGSSFIANNNGFGTNTFLTNATITALSVSIPVGGPITFKANGQPWSFYGPQSAVFSGVYLGFGNPAGPFQEQGSFVVGTTNDVQASGTTMNGATILGGAYNNIFPAVIQDYSTIAGGISNSIKGGYSFASGVQSSNAFASDWVWNDWPNGVFASTGTNQFLVHSINGFGFNTNAPGFKTFNINGNLVLNGTNIFSAIQSATGANQTNGFTPIVFTNVDQVEYQYGSHSNNTAYGFLSIGGGLTYIISTNVLGVTNCAFTPVNGTYNNYGTAGDWTNLFDARWTLHMGPPNNYSFRSNGIIIYLGGSAFVGTNYAAQGTAATPTPVVYIGGYLNPFGFIKNPSDVLQGTNDPNGIIIAPKGSAYQHFTGTRPDYILVNTNSQSGWY